jgi:hypothetical protein
MVPWYNRLRTSVSTVFGKNSLVTADSFSRYHPFVPSKILKGLQFLPNIRNSTATLSK